MTKKYKFVIPIVFCIVISLIAFLPYLTTNYINNGIDISYHLSRLEGLAQSIKDGNFFPKIYLYKNNGYGYPWPLFYCDLFLIIPALLYNFGLSLINAYKLAMFIPILLTSFFSYYGFRSISKNKILPYLSSILFISLDVFLSDIYTRSGLGSVWAWPFLILVVIGSYKLLYCEEKKSLIFLIVGFTGLALSHNISFFFGVFYFILILLLNIFQLIKNKRKILYLFIAAIVSFGLCAYFLLPMLEIKMHQVLIMDQNYSYGANKSTYVDLFNTINQVKYYFLFDIVLMFIIEYKDKNVKRIYFNVCLLLISIFFILASSQYFHLPLTFTQFKSRTLPIARICYCIPLLIYGSCFISRYLNKYLQLGIVLLLVLNLFNISNKWYKVVENDDLLFDENSTLSDVLEYYVGYNSTVDTLIIEPDVDWLYLPASWNYNYREQPCVVTLEERKQVTCDIKKLDHGETSINWKESMRISNNVLFPVSYYKGYKVIFDDEAGNTITQPVMGDWQTGLVTVNVPTDFNEGTITIVYGGTKLQKVSAFCSVATLFLIVTYVIYIKRRKI